MPITYNRLASFSVQRMRAQAPFSTRTAGRASVGTWPATEGIPSGVVFERTSRTLVLVVGNQIADQAFDRVLHGTKVIEAVDEIPLKYHTPRRCTRQLYGSFLVPPSLRGPFRVVDDLHQARGYSAYPVFLVAAVRHQHRHRQQGPRGSRRPRVEGPRSACEAVLHRCGRRAA